ncbi:asparaginyl-tRNA synthetase [Hypoxylon sp. FL1150]|nr:asparaginyl-tRNA synthetase [Hypoxylon sp. FL1150]
MTPLRPLLRGARLERLVPLKLSPLTPRAFISTAPIYRNVAHLLHFMPLQPIPGIKIDGFIRSIRAQKKHHFVALGDGSSLDPIQAVIPSDQAEGLTIGAAVRLHGSWVPSRGQGQTHELRVERATVLGPSDSKTYPIQNKYQTPDYLRTLPHLRSRVPFNTTVLRLRSDVMAALTEYFKKRRFIQTHTPILTSSDCEGAGEVFHVSARDPDAPPTPSASKTKRFFRRPVYTTVSAQLHLEALSQSLGNVWTLSPTFRAEQSDTPRHLSEFYMLEAEMAFADSMDSVMDLVEDMLRYVSNSLIGNNATLSRPGIQGQFFSELFRERDEHDGKHLTKPEIVNKRWEGLLQRKWPRITYTHAIEILKQAKKRFNYEPVWGRELRTEHEKYIAAEVGGRKTPVFVTHYPRDIKAFYMKASDGDASVPGATVDCFDLLVPDFCEIAGGSMREHRLENLRDSMRARGIPLPETPSSFLNGTSEPSSSPQQPSENDLGWYLDLRRWGCPPHGGFGLGFDRLICYLTGVQTIHDTAAFPRWYGRCDC